MNNINNEMGSFICARRRDRGLTQRQLAERLHLTDKAVSKWERGLSCPDITLLPALAEALGVTTAELLEGRQGAEPPVPEKEAAVQAALQYAGETRKKEKRGAARIAGGILSLSFLIGILSCVIVDFSITQSFTWSLYPIFSCVFAWLILAPLFYIQKRRILLSMLSLTLFTIPFLAGVMWLAGEQNWLLPLGIPCAAAGLVFLWAVYFLFFHTRIRPWFRGGLVLLLACAMQFAIDFLVGLALHEPGADIWNWLSAVVLALAAFVCFALGGLRRNGTGEEHQ